jgi:hypothetical protein
MGAFKDLAIVEENSKQEDITMVVAIDKDGTSAKLSDELLEVAREYHEITLRRRMCCQPYDCMHHELCEGEGAECGSCEDRRNADRLLEELSADLAHNPDQMAVWWTLDLVEQDALGDRNAFYKQMRALGNEDATHWMDEEAAR